MAGRGAGWRGRSTAPSTRTISCRGPQARAHPWDADAAETWRGRRRRNRGARAKTTGPKATGPKPRRPATRPLRPRRRGRARPTPRREEGAGRGHLKSGSISVDRTRIRLTPRPARPARGSVGRGSLCPDPRLERAGSRSGSRGPGESVVSPAPDTAAGHRSRMPARRPAQAALPRVAPLPGAAARPEPPSGESVEIGGRRDPPRRGAFG